MPRQRVVFMGSPEFAVASLQALMEAGHDIISVYTQPPKPSGRGNQMTKTPVHLFAEERGLEVRTPSTLRTTTSVSELFYHQPDAVVVAAYGLLLPRDILSIPTLGCINVHASLLPRWRGAAPIQRAILAGDTETGVTLMQMEEGLDTGPMIMQERVAITPDTTAMSLHDELAVLGGKMLVSLFDGTGRIHYEPQPKHGATYATKLTRDDGRIDWTQDAEVVHRQIRALTPWPGCWFEARDVRIKVLSAEITEGDGQPGLVLDNQFTIACGRGAVRLTSVQRPGKSPVDGASFLRGFNSSLELSSNLPILR